MKIKRLYIGDMGIYRNALMENISSKIVVIGGLNRSGKTTLLEILRHMPYGFTKHLRPSTVEYSIECDLENEIDEKISLRVNGLKEPQISFNGKEGKAIIKDLYGSIDKFTYSQLYTITLDELKKLSVKGEEEKLQAILLGAGVTDIVHIPKLLVSLRNEKEKIGGKQGKPTIKFFKPSYEKLLSGIEAKEEALKQVEKFALKEKEEIELNKEVIIEYENINKLKDQVLLLEVLESYFEDYKNAIELKTQIEALHPIRSQIDFSKLPSLEKLETYYEEYIEVYNSYNEAEKKFKLSANKAEVNYNELLKSETIVKHYSKNISGLRQREEEYNTLKNNYELNKEIIVKGMTNLNSDFNGDFIKVLNINCDLINEVKLAKVLEEITSIKEEISHWNSLLKTESLQGEVIEKEFKALKNNEKGNFLKNYLYISLGILFLSVFIYFINKAFAAGLFITGVTTAIFYHFIRHGDLNSLNNRLINLELQLKSIESKQEVYTQKLNQLKVNENESLESLSFYKQSLQLEGEVSPQLLLQYFKDIKVLKSQIIDLGNQGRRIKNYEQQLIAELEDIYKIAERIIILPFDHNESILKYSREIFEVIEMLDIELDFVKTQNTAKQKFLEVEVKLLERLQIEKCEKPLMQFVPELIEKYKVLNNLKELQLRLEIIEKNISKAIESERVTNAFKTLGQVYDIEKKDNIDCLYYMFNIYPIKSEIQKDLLTHNNMLNNALKRYELLKEKLHLVKIELNNLSTSNKLEQAQQLIDEGRLGLQPLTVRYSVYHAAEYILDTVQKDFLDNAKHKLLKGAGDIFSKITGGEYKAVLPGDNLLQTEYKTLSENKNTEETTSILSRGTSEQLYLSVRLNRIKSINEKLPIIFDDPFVNFDDIHIKNTLEIISNISEENQIFILTCHPEVIKLIKDITEDVQYWKLNKGNFKLSSSGKLIEYLSET